MSANKLSINYFLENLEDKMVEIINTNINTDSGPSSNVLTIDPTILIVIRNKDIELMKIIKNKDGGIQIEPILLAGIMIDDHSHDTAPEFIVPAGICKKGKRWILCSKDYSGKNEFEILLESLLDNKLSDDEESARLESLVLQKNFRLALNDNTIKNFIIIADNEELGMKFKNILYSFHKYEKFNEKDDKIKELLKNVTYMPAPEEEQFYYAFFEHLEELHCKDNKYLFLSENNGELYYKFIIYENSKFKEVSPDKKLSIEAIDKVGLLLNSKPRPPINQEGIRFFENKADFQRNGIAKYIIIKDKLIDLEFTELNLEYEKLLKEKASLKEKKEKIVSLINSLSSEFNIFLEFTEVDK